MPTAGHTEPDFLPGADSPGFRRFFTRYVNRLLAKRFHAVRVAADSEHVLKEAADDPAPLLICLSHSSWWDPLLCVFLGGRYLAQRTPLAPMDISMLRKFGLFRKLGLFGVEPDDPRAIRQMQRYAAERFALDPRPTLWITPQGRFCDVRAPMVLRPGAASIAARTPNLRCVCIAAEYGFWLDQKPEIFLRFAGVRPPERPTTAAWHRRLTEAMSANGAALAALVTARSPAPFTTLAGAGASINPIYDLWLRVTGRRVNIDAPRAEGRAS